MVSRQGTEKDKYLLTFCEVAVGVLRNSPPPTPPPPPPTTTTHTHTTLTHKQQRIYLARFPPSPNPLLKTDRTMVAKTQSCENVYASKSNHTFECVCEV